MQEFKDAPALSIPRSFDPDQIKEIAISVLEILVYLQDRIPVVIHRDIKPENVLVDEYLNVYLIDFGFARIGGGEVAMSSVAAGTFGFMAPEQPEARRSAPGFIFFLLETIAIFGINLAVLLARPNGYLMLVTLGSAVVIAYLLLFVPLQRQQEIAAYRQREKHLIRI